MHSAIGESVGVLAAYCVERGDPPHAVRNTPDLPEDLQRVLQSQGVSIRWSRPARTPL